MSKGIFGTIKGELKIVDKLDKLYKVGLTAQRKTVVDATLLIHEKAVKSIQDNRDGTRQTRYDPTRQVFVSRPGDPPNADLGRLAQSIKFEFVEKGLVGKVGTNLKYGAALEFGTQKMEPRPWLEPAVSASAKEIAKIAKENAEDVIKGVGKK